MDGEGGTPATFLGMTDDEFPHIGARIAVAFEISMEALLEKRWPCTWGQFEAGVNELHERFSMGPQAYLPHYNLVKKCHQLLADTNGKQTFELEFAVDPLVS